MVDSVAQCLPDAFEQVASHAGSHQQWCALSFVESANWTLMLPSEGGQHGDEGVPAGVSSAVLDLGNEGRSAAEEAADLQISEQTTSTWRREALPGRTELVTVDAVARPLDPRGPDKLYVADITEHPTAEGKVYLAVVIDAWTAK